MQTFTRNKQSAFSYSSYGRIACVILLSIFILAGTMPAFADNTAISTSSGQYVLTDPSKLLGENALKSAESTADLAMGALAADAKALEEKQKKLDEDTKNYTSKLNAAKTELDSRWADYKVALDKYNGLLNTYEGELNAYSNDVASQRAQVAQSDALQPTQRSQANVNRLNAWKANLDSQKSALEAQKRNLDGEKAVLDAQRAANLDFQKSKQAEFEAEYESLKLRGENLKVKQGEAYRQLQLCHSYALQIRKTLSSKYHVSTSTQTATWTDAEEQLKELSNKGFDGNSDKQPLQNNGTGTDFFSKSK